MGCRADLFSLVSSDIRDIRYLTPRQYSKLSFVPGSLSLGGKEKDAQTFNNQDSENCKEQFQLGITHTEVQRGIKENHREKNQTGIPDPEPFCKAGKPL